MSYVYRPGNLSERESVLSAIEDFRADPNANPVALSIEQACFAPAATIWEATARRHAYLMLAAGEASDDADSARRAFRTALRLWWKSVNDDEGRGRASDLAALLGGTTPGQILKKKPREQVTLAQRLLAMIGESADLRGDPALWSALGTALADFKGRVDDDEAATRAQVSQGARVNEASPAFDAAYGLLVRNFRLILGEAETWRILPRFLRSNGTVAGGTEPLLGDSAETVPENVVEPTETADPAAGDL